MIAPARSPDYNNTLNALMFFNWKISVLAPTANSRGKNAIFVSLRHRQQQIAVQGVQRRIIRGCLARWLQIHRRLFFSLITAAHRNGPTPAPDTQPLWRTTRWSWAVTGGGTGWDEEGQLSGYCGNNLQSKKIRVSRTFAVFTSYQPWAAHAHRQV